MLRKGSVGVGSIRGKSNLNSIVLPTPNSVKKSDKASEQVNTPQNMAGKVSPTPQINIDQKLNQRERLLKILNTVGRRSEHSPFQRSEAIVSPLDAAAQHPMFSSKRNLLLSAAAINETSFQRKQQLN